MQLTVNLLLGFAVVVYEVIAVAPTPNTPVGALNRIKELCRAIKDADQVVYNAFDMRHKPTRDKELLNRFVTC